MKKVFGFLKGMFGTKKEEPEIVEERVSLDTLESWLENKAKDFASREKEVLIGIKDKVKIVVKDLKEKLEPVEAIDIEQKNVENRIKSIVKGNLDNYINLVKQFIEKIHTLDEEKLGKFSSSINAILGDFEKKTFVCYQKASFLAGKEMAEVTKSIVEFSGYLKNEFEENKDIIDFFKTASFVELKLSQIKKLKIVIKNIEERKITLDKKIKDAEQNKKNISGEIEIVKKSAVYVENIKKIDTIKSVKKEIEDDIHALKQMIDLNTLANVFHSDDAKWGVIKSYKANFSDSFQKDNGTDILALIDEAKLDKAPIVAKIKQINDKQSNLAKETVEKDKTEDLLFKTKEIESEIKNLVDERDVELKKYESFKANRKEEIKAIKQELSKINAILI